MKLRLKTRILCACLAMSLLATACGGASEDLDTQSVSVEKGESEVVTSPATGDTENAEDVVTEPELTAEEQEWLNYLLPNVEDSLNVRVEASADAELAGKLSKGDVATVLEVGDEFTKISSGNLVGYVSNDYCIYGLDALAYAKENFDTVATTTTDGLRIRASMDTESEIIKRLDLGDSVVVDTAAAVEDGWVAVIYNDNTYYVSAEYVTVGLDLGTGLTMEEIYEIQRAQAEAEAAAQAAANQQQGAATTNQGAISYEVSDLDLLAALIYCEAGAESYDVQLGVASVVMNRVRSSTYPNNIYDVIHQRGQFSPVREGKLARVLANGSATSSCYEAASQALAGADNTDGAIGFAYASSGKAGVVYGSVVFFK